jgi:hypothetical protein
MAEETAVIANLTAQSWMLHRNYGAFFIRPAESAQDLSAAQAANSDSAGRGASDANARQGSEASRAAQGDSTANRATNPSPLRRGDAGDVTSAASASPRQNNESHSERPAGSEESLFLGRRTDASRALPTPSLTRVTPRKSIIDLGDKRTIDVNISAREIAQDLCREINGDAGEDSFLGAFVCAGDAPTAEELADARRRLDAFYRRKVSEADREWARSHSHLFLDDLQRRAANHLGLEREWNYQLHETSDCPGCGERLKPGVAVCKSCGAILDREKARALGLWRDDASAALGARVASGAPGTPSGGGNASGTPSAAAISKSAATSPQASQPQHQQHANQQQRRNS